MVVSCEKAGEQYGGNGRVGESPCVFRRGTWHAVDQVGQVIQGLIDVQGGGQNVGGIQSGRKSRGERGKRELGGVLVAAGRDALLKLITSAGEATAAVGDAKVPS